MVVQVQGSQATGRHLSGSTGQAAAGTTLRLSDDEVDEEFERHLPRPTLPVSEELKAGAQRLRQDREAQAQLGAQPSVQAHPALVTRPHTGNRFTSLMADLGLDVDVEELEEAVWEALLQPPLPRGPTRLSQQQRPRQQPSILADQSWTEWMR